MIFWLPLSAAILSSLVLVLRALAKHRATQFLAQALRDIDPPKTYTLTLKDEDGNVMRENKVYSVRAVFMDADSDYANGSLHEGCLTVGPLPFVCRNLATAGDVSGALDDLKVPSDTRNHMRAQIAAQKIIDKHEKVWSSTRSSK